MIIQHFTSGITGFPVFFTGLILVSLFVYKTIKICKSKNPSNIGLHGIWLLGLLAFLFRLLEQTFRIGAIFDTLLKVSEPKNINADVVLKDFGDALNYQLSGLMILILSLIFFGTLIGLRNVRSQKLTTKK